MELIRLNEDNIEREHICCAISNNNDCQVSSKKAWLRDRFKDGLVFLRGNVRGKCFIEYIPAEKAWAPIKADGYMYIDCLWVSGQFKGQGYSTLLLDECISDSKAKGKKGLCILSAKKKMPFLSDPKFLVHKGFAVADSAEPYYQLYYLPFEDDTDKPCFSESVKQSSAYKDGYVLYYTHQCPYTAKYVPVAEDVAKACGVPFKAVLIDSAEDAQNAPAPFTSYSLFYNGSFLTNEIMSDKKLEKLFTERK